MKRKARMAMRDPITDKRTWCFTFGFATGIFIGMLAISWKGGHPGDCVFWSSMVWLGIWSFRELARGDA